jgi:prepilin-type N-terminal cleavage/methylation domain-containing protein
MTSATGKSRRVRIHPLRWNRAGFTLVELLSVVAIMAIVMAALGYAVSNMGGPAPQVAAAQVASGLSLARQYAVAKNLETRFLICNLDGSSGSGLPPESWRYWSIIQTNRGTGKWTMLKEWEKLPAGVVFLNLEAGKYATRSGNPITGAKLGEAFAPIFGAADVSDGAEWQHIQSSANGLTVEVAGKSFTLGNTACVGYRGAGEAVKGDGSTLGGAGGMTMEMAIRIAPGVATADNKIILKSTNNYYYIETDRQGRVRVRSPESFKN